MTRLPPICDQRFVQYPERHLLAIEGLHPPAIAQLLDLAESYVLLNRSGKTQRDLLRGKTVINLFFEDSTRTRTSFELAGKRLGADVINMSVSTSSVNKGETLLDTAATLNAMQCDLLVVRHDQSGAPNLLAQKVDAAVILQRERMTRSLVPSAREFFRFWGLDAEKLAFAKPDALVMHPGPMNRGVEIDSAVADDPARSVIKEQVEMGVAVRMAVLDVLARNPSRGRNER